MGTLSLAAQKKLLDAARGFLLARPRGSSAKQRVMRCFPLKEHHVVPPPPSPGAFHEALCRKIRACQHRVYLASLYVGPAACPAASVKEQELLDALESTRARSVQILLDQNRALRPVPVIRSNDASFTNAEQKQSDATTTITSAEACHRVLERRRKNSRKNGTNKLENENDDGIYLLSVLPAYQQRLLKNPLNEVAGVFHLKCYIMDNDMVITGANLSEEYYVDRTDRYLWISSSNGDDDGEHDEKSDDSNSSHPLIECYADLLQALCRHAEPYKEHSRNNGSRTTREELLESLTEILTEEATEASNEKQMDGNSDKDIVAYAIPTLQTPRTFFGGHNNGRIPSDADLTSSLIEHAAPEQEIRIASAYLNPTDQLRRSLQTAFPPSAASHSVHFLTAGLTSHGFKPKHKPGNKGKTWIPAVYDTLSRKHLAADLSDIWYYVRPGWTFHCKGLWLTTTSTPIAVSETPASIADESKTEYSPVLPSSSTVSAVITGSGNFGYRSAACDMESNVILVFAATKDEQHSQLQRSFREEWNELCRHAKSAHTEDPLPLQWPLRLLLPVIRYFF